jgi:hypothetical protein
VCSWQSSFLLGGVCRAIRLLKSFICDGFGSDQSFFFQECSACSRLRSNWVAIEFFFFPLSFLSHALEIRDNPFKKQLCPLICNFIDFDPYYFNYYLFWFSCFWSFAFFFSISSLGILFHLILYPSWSSYIWLLLFCVLYIFPSSFFNFIHYHFIAFVFFNSILVFILLIAIFFYSFLDLPFFFLNILFLFVFYSILVIILSIIFFILF